FPTVTGGRSRSEAICWFGWPAAAAKTIRLLSTSACAVDGACTKRFKVVLVFGSRLMAGAIRGMPQRTRISLYYKELSGRCTSSTIQKPAALDSLNFRMGVGGVLPACRGHRVFPNWEHQTLRVS